MITRITGARVNFRALGLNFSAYAGVHQNDYAQLTSTAGFLVPGLYSPDLNRFQPQGGAGAARRARLHAVEQSAGVRATYVGKKFQIGGTYVRGGGVYLGRAGHRGTCSATSRSSAWTSACNPSASGSGVRRRHGEPVEWTSQ